MERTKTNPKTIITLSWLQSHPLQYNAGHAGQPDRFLFTRRGLSQPQIVAVGIYETENYIIAHSFETRVREKNFPLLIIIVIQLLTMLALAGYKYAAI